MKLSLHLFSAFLIITGLHVLGLLRPDETGSAYADQGAPYFLVQLDSQESQIAAYISFDTNGAFFGRAPCNQFSGRSTVPYPWFRVENLATTKMICPDIDADRAFLAALHNMMLIEFSGPLVMLSNDAGQMMIFEQH